MKRSSRASALKHSNTTIDPHVLKNALSDKVIIDLLQIHQIHWRERVFSPLTTLWIFISQVLASDKSCRSALAGYWGLQKPARLVTSAYCRARRRLSEGFLWDLFQRQTQSLQAQVPANWKWKQRAVKLVDGTTISMPDTADNKTHYPAHNPKNCAVSFPLMRAVVVLCHASGAVLQAAMGPYQGKGSGETSLFRRLLASFQALDVVVFDRYYSGYWMLASLQQRQIDFVTRQHHKRQVSQRRRIGHKQYMITIDRPPRRDMNIEEYESLPAQLHLREIHVHVTQKGFRTRQIILLTSLMEPLYSVEDLADLYRQRWNVELDIRNIKSRMAMSVLRCQTAEMVRKELCVHLLAYNLIRAVMMDAALIAGQFPRDLSFAAAIQLSHVFRIQLSHVTSKTFDVLYSHLLTSLSHERVRLRPNRIEPRAIKRRPHCTNIPYLTKTRQQAIVEQKSCKPTG